MTIPKRAATRAKLPEKTSKRRAAKSAPLTKSEATREHILATALAAFRRRGFERTTMRDVAAEAGVALGAAYYYFASKDALVLAYYRSTQDEHTRRAREAMIATSDLDARLRAVFHTKLDLLARDRKMLGAIFRSVADPDDPASIFGATTRDVRDESIVLFEEAIELVPGLDPTARAIVARALWSLHMGTILYFLHDASPGQAKTRALVDGAIALASQLVALAPMLGGTLEPLAAILRDAELLGRA